MTQPQHSNIRRWPRYKLDLPVRVIVERADATKVVQGRGNELNEGGMAVFAGVELSLESIVAIEFTPPYSGEPLRARAVIRSRNGYTYGLEFLTDTPEDEQSADHIRSVIRGYGKIVK